ncbi:MobF family relaxase, partial [Corynebacterium variabile]|uniref:MobF family relaxase n=1 Tax=Corynebacterium variabile TaxID=1727 RepID=UPI003BAF00F9
MMSLKVLHAGDGYAYLTRQVATGDNVRTRGELLADYYTAHGAPAGQWWGRGAAELGVDGEVTEAQMQAAYGEFLHPDASQYKLKKLIAEGASVEEALDSVRLGRRVNDFNKDIPFLAAVKEQTIAFVGANARVPSPEERDEIEQIVARRMLAEADEEAARRAADSDYAALIEGVPDDGFDSRIDLAGDLAAQLAGRDEDLADQARDASSVLPITDARVRHFIAEAKRDARYPVAGFDMVFTPAKSISVLWGIGDERTRKAIMRAHSEAVEQSLQWIEDNAVFSRTGAQGQEKVDCEGATVAKFVHFDNRAGDPNLHTHCAMLNRVKCADGVYRTIDSKVVHRATVTASESYNTKVTELVARYLGVEFTATTKSRGGRPVWEVKGIPDELLAAMSRRDDVLSRGRELIAEYRKTYGRTPPKHVQYRLMEQANLETRAAKGEARSLQEMVGDWRVIADNASSDFDCASVLDDVFSAADSYLPEPGEGATTEEMDAWHAQEAVRRHDWTDNEQGRVVARVMAALSAERSTWTEYQIDSEVSRQLTYFRFESDAQKKLVTAKTRTRCLEGVSIRVDADQILPGVDADSISPRLRRRNGESVFTAHATARFTSQAVLDDEQTVTGASQLWIVNEHTTDQLDDAMSAVETARGYSLSADKREFVNHLLCSPAALAVGVGPAGTGKTTAMEVFARAWEASGHKVVGLAPSAVAAEVLAGDTGVPTATVASFIHPGTDHVAKGIDVHAGDVILIDEAGMASTHDLAEVVRKAEQVGAFVRLVGDPGQLASIETGGMLGELAASTDAPVLTEVNRFTHPDEADAGLRLRDGDADVLDWYDNHGRITSGLREELPGEVFGAWWDAKTAGKSAVMIAGDRGTVDVLNDMARDRYLDLGVVTPTAGEATISGGHKAAVGDVIVTRQNNSKLRYGKNKAKRVKNGDLWTVAAVGKDGSLTVTKTADGVSAGHSVVLPADYVTEQVELGYASTIYRSQGITVDAAFTIPAAALDRQGLYVAMTRGRETNQVFVPDDQVPDVDSHLPQGQAMSARQYLTAIINRDGSAVTAHAALAAADEAMTTGAGFDVHTVASAYRELAEELAVQTVVAAAGADAESAELLADDWQTRRLAEAVGRLDAAGADTDRVLGEAIAAAKVRWDESEPDEDGTKESLAFLVRMVLSDNDTVKRPADDDLGFTVGVPLPVARETGGRAEVLADEELHDFVVSTYAVIQEHLAEVGDTAVTEIPQWTTVIGAPHGDDPEYDAAWSRAVRLVAAAGTTRPELLTVEGLTSFLAERGEDTSRRDLALHKAIDAVGVAERRSKAPESPLVALPDGQLRGYIANAGEKIDALDTQIAQAVGARTTASRYPRLSELREEYDRVAADAETISLFGDMQDEHDTARQNERDAQREMHAAKSSVVIGRKARVEAATVRFDQARQTRQRIQAQMDQLRGLLPSSALHEQIVASAGNTAGWQRRFDQATILDEKAIDAAQSKIDRLTADRGLWRDRRRSAETLLESRTPATRDQVKARLDNLRRELEANHAAEAAEMDQQAEQTPRVPEYRRQDDGTDAQDRRRRGREFLDELRKNQADETETTTDTTDHERIEDDHRPDTTDAGAGNPADRDTD